MYFATCALSWLSDMSIKYLMYICMHAARIEFVSEIVGMCACMHASVRLCVPYIYIYIYIYIYNWHT